MSRRTEGLWRRKGFRVALLGAAILAGAGASRLSAEVDNVPAGGSGTYGALPIKEPGTAQVIGYYCTGIGCYDSELGGKYRFCCVH